MQASSTADASSAAKFPLRTLADAPVDDDAADRFGYADIADGLARLIEGKGTATPLTIALSAPWGAGKTSLLRLVESRVVRQRAARGEAPTIVVWFNAWMHDAAPNLSAALAADIARNATRCRKRWMRLWHPLPSSMLSPKERARRRFWLGVAALISSIAIYPLVSFLIGPSDGDVAKVRAAFGASAVGWFVLLWGLSALWPRVQRSVAAVAAFVDDPRSAAATGSMPEVSAQLGELIREAQDGVRRAWRAPQRPRFVVVVDDLERCQPPKAVDMCEVAAQLLDHSGVITVLVGDLRVIAASAELKYRDAANQFSNNADFAAEGWGRFYLQKVVQFELELPPIPEERLRQLARSAPATASIHGSSIDRSTPMPSLLVRIRQSFVTRLLIGLILVAFTPFLASNLRAGFSLAILAITVILPVIAWSSYRSGRIEKLRADVSRLVDNVISEVLSQPGSPMGSAELEAEVVSRVEAETAKYESRKYWKHARDLASAEEVHRRLQLHAADDNETISRANKVILELLPPLPRTAKRLLNRLYFLLVVAYNRDLITRNRVSAEQLGKWAVLLDRWPEAGKAIIKNPQLVQALEDAAKWKVDFASLCSAHTPPLASDPASLRDFFQTDHKLASAAYHLVYLDADATPEASSGMAVIGPTAEAEPTAMAPAYDAAPASATVTPSDGRPDTKEPIVP